MQFVLSPFGSSGDVYPMISLGLALKARGHEVSMVINGYFRELSERVGLSTIEFGSKEQFLTLTEQPGLWQPMKSLGVIYGEGVAPIMREHFDLLKELTGGQRDAVMVSNVWGIGARVAYDKLAIPLVTLHLQPSAIWSDIVPPRLPMVRGPRPIQRLLFRLGEKLVIDRTICPSLNAWRRELELPPVAKITRWWQSPWCVASFFPDWFAPPQRDWPQPHLQADFPMWDHEPDAELSEELRSFLDRGSPPIVFTPGSANVHGSDFFRAAHDTCQRLNQRGIFVTRFPQQLPDDLGSSILHVPYVPFSLLLPKVAAIVHHGGIGTMSQAMKAGTPQAIVALAYDQFDNLDRCRKLNIADGCSHRQLSASRLTKTLDQLLNSPDVKKACASVSNRFNHSDGPQQLAIAIETRAQKKEPTR